MTCRVRWQPVALLLCFALALTVSYVNEGAIWQFYGVGGLGVLLILRSSQEGIEDGVLLVVMVPILTELSVRVVGLSVSIAEMFYYLFVLSVVFVHGHTWNIASPLKATPSVRQSERLVLWTAVTTVALLPFSEDLKQSLNRIRELILPLTLVSLICRLRLPRTFIGQWRVVVIGSALLSTAICFVQFTSGHLFLVEAEDLDFATSFKIKEATAYLIFNWLGAGVEHGLGRGLNYFAFGYSETMLIPLSLLAATALWARRSFVRVLCGVCVAVVWFGILVTGSRSVLLTGTAGIVILAIWRGGWLRGGALWMAALGFPLTLYLIPALSFLFSDEELGTLFGRLDLTAAFVKYASEYPLQCLTGSSIEKLLARTGMEQPPHHFMLFGIARDGLIVTAVVIMLFVVILYRSWYAINRQILADANASVMAGLWVGLFVRIFFYGQSTYLTWSTPHNIDLFLAMGLLLHFASDGSCPTAANMRSVEETIPPVADRVERMGGVARAARRP